MSTRNIAIVSHGHPEISPGGGEQAAYALFRQLRQAGGFDPLFLAWATPDRLGHSGSFAAFRERSDEILWSTPGLDHFRLLSQEPSALRRQVAEVFTSRPVDLVHMHHYWLFGTDMIPMIRDELGIPVVVTLHEYLAICHNHGQMIRTSGRLCHGASHAECGGCFPEHGSGQFFARKARLLENFASVDLFISPSRFLADRYIAWGLEPERIRVIENPLASHAAAGAASCIEPRPDDAGRRIQLGYFGQMSPFKGIDILLDAVAQLAPAIRQRVRLVLFGANIENQSDEFRSRIAAKLEALQDCVLNYGPYRNEQVMELMRGVDWAVMPSVWWENSPVVIQEARLAGVPVLCSDIGGMREKVRLGIDGLHFATGNRMDLAEKITAIVEDRVRIEPSAEPHPALGAFDEIVAAYDGLLARKTLSGTSAATRQPVICRQPARHIAEPRPAPAAHQNGSARILIGG